MAIGDALALLRGNAKIARRPGFNQYILQVGDASKRKCRQDTRVRLRNFPAHGELIGNDARLGTSDMVPIFKYARVKICDAVPGLAEFRIITADKSKAGRISLEPVQLFQAPAMQWFRTMLRRSSSRAGARLQRRGQFRLCPGDQAVQVTES